MRPYLHNCDNSFNPNSNLDLTTAGSLYSDLDYADVECRCIKSVAKSLEDVALDRMRN